MFVKFLLFIFISFLFCLSSVNASVYTPSQHLFENTYSNNLIDLAHNQVEDFELKYYVILQDNNNYYLIASDDYSISGSVISMINSIVFSAIRNTNVNGNYQYSKINETSTTINLNYVVESNIVANNTNSSLRFEDYKQNYEDSKFNLDFNNVLIFILGLVFAIFITKERKF